MTVARPKNSKLLIAISLAVGLLMTMGCGGGESPTATPAPSPSATETPVKTATPAPSELSSEELLEGVKAAMAALDSFHIEGELVLKATREADANLFSMQIEGFGNVDGDNQLSLGMDISTPGFAGKLTIVTREVQGVNYIQDTDTGEWEIGDTDDAGDGLSDDLVPENMVATEVHEEVLGGLPVYRIIGFVPDDPERERMVLWVGAEDLLVRQRLEEGQIPAADYWGLIPQDVGDPFQSILVRLSRLNEPVLVVAPSVKITPTPSPATVPVHLWISNQSLGAATSEVQMTISSKGQAVFDQSVAAGTQHSVVKVDENLLPGSYEIDVSVREPFVTFQHVADVTSESWLFIRFWYDPESVHENQQTPTITVDSFDSAPGIK